MRKRWIEIGLTVVATAWVGCSSIPVPELPVDHAEFDSFLARHVDAFGRVDYRAAREDRGDLDRYLAQVASTSPDRNPNAFPTEEDRLAYWIGAYNAWTIALVLDAYPIDSVLDVRNPLRWIHPGAGFFYLQRVLVGGHRVSLYSLENRIIRDRFDEPRIHFALNCASLGCPRLPREAFRPERLEEQLSAETLRFLDEPHNLDVDLEARRVFLSSIFDWYESDFAKWARQHLQHVGRDEGLRRYVEAHASPRLAAALASCRDCEIVFRPYDWALNDQR